MPRCILTACRLVRDRKDRFGKLRRRARSRKVASRCISPGIHALLPCFPPPFPGPVRFTINSLSPFASPLRRAQRRTLIRRVGADGKRGGKHASASFRKSLSIPFFSAASSMASQCLPRLFLSMIPRPSHILPGYPPDR